MDRHSSFRWFGAWLMSLAACAAGQAQTPDCSPISAPRSDLYTIYSDAFFNPQTVAPATCDSAQAAPGIRQHLESSRHWRYFAGADFLHYTRNNPINKVLVRTSFNIFDDIPGQMLVGSDLYPSNTSGSPNDTTLRLNVPASEYLSPGQIRMQTDDFDTGWQQGTRINLGIEFANDDQLVFSYFFLDDFSDTLVDDVSGAAFYTTQISNSGEAYFQRFGYLFSPVLTGDARFFGESRREITLGSTEPHDPANEDPAPPVTVTDANSSDVPREPTNDDYPDITNSLLWSDGELAIADYAFDLQGAELMYKRRLFAFRNADWQVRMLMGVRYLSLDENFLFLFADTTYDRAAANPGTEQIIVVPPPNSGPITEPGTSAQSAAEVTAVTGAGVENDMVGPQIGMEAHLPFWSYFEWDMMSKAGFMANWMHNRRMLVRGDGVVGFDIEKDNMLTSGVVEGQFGASCYLTPNLKVRGGWEFMWLINVGSAIDQFVFELDRDIRPKNGSNFFFHGFYAGAELTF